MDSIGYSIEQLQNQGCLLWSRNWRNKELQRTIDIKYTELILGQMAKREDRYFIKNRELSRLPKIRGTYYKEKFTGGVMLLLNELLNRPDIIGDETKKAHVLREGCNPSINQYINQGLLWLVDNMDQTGLYERLVERFIFSCREEMLLVRNRIGNL